MEKIFSRLPQKIIELSFYALFFLVPLVLTPFNYELFEYNKMMLTYGLTAMIVGSWIIKMIAGRQIIFKRSPLDIPLILFLASQIISTIISIDPHVSLWGYYSRFNGGLLSTISYLLLYWAFVSNFPGEKIRKLLKVILISGILVSIYGVLEHLGIDKNIWVQDVQNRIFSTLGQPNWLAAYLSVLIPITTGIGLSKILNQISDSKGKVQSSKFKVQNQTTNIFSIGLLGYWVIGSIFYTTLIFTKSRSGFLGFWTANIIFWLLYFIKQKKSFLKIFITFNFLLLTLNFLFGSPFDQLNRFTLPQLINHQSSTANNQQSSIPAGSSVIEVGITGSDTIRKIVWTGAIDIFRHYPLFGTGVETFAFSYYKFRPVAHNMTSEWDFLYNKAHNEYLNYAATTGSFGLGSYLLVILVFIGWNLSKLKVPASPAGGQSSNIKSSSKFLPSRQADKVQNHLDFGFDLDLWILSFGLFAGWLSILITNFFGFSVVIIQLFLFLIPAVVFVLNENLKSGDQSNNQTKEHLTFNIQQWVMIVIIFSVICYMLYAICKFWYADVLYADGYHKNRSDDVTGAYQSLKKALDINQTEPVYYDEFSYPAAELAVAFSDNKQATLSGVLTKEAILASTYAINHAPQNVNFWKSRTRVFYALSQLDEKYFSDALFALQQAKVLSPTDPKVSYNLGLLYDRIGKTKEAIAELVTTTKLKPDYRDAFYALGYLYEKDNQRNKAKDSLKYILTKIATDDAEAKKKLEELK